MGTDFIDRDLMDAASRRRSDSDFPRPRRAADRTVDRSSELAALQERQAELEAERRAITELQEKQSSYSALRESLEADLAAALERIGTAHDTLAAVLQITEESESELHELDARLADIQEDRWDDSRLAEELDAASQSLAGIREAYEQVAAKLQDAESAGAGLSLGGGAAPGGGLRSWWAGLSPRAREGWAWGLGAALPLLGVALAVSLAWWLFLLWWW